MNIGKIQFFEDFFYSIFFDGMLKNLHNSGILTKNSHKGI